MDINSIQFISHRDSIASNFASQMEKSSMLSSRRRLMDDSEENDLEDFKQEIQFKFIRSIANKMYTFPLNEEGFDMFNDEEEYADLIGVSQYNLMEQEKPHLADNRFKKQQFKIKNPKLSSKTANLLLQTLRSERQRISNLRALINEGQDVKNSKAGALYADAIQQTNRQYIQEQGVQNYRKKRLNTEPYEKPMGFIIKKK